MNLDQFNKLDKEILECILCAVKTVAKKKFGYQCSFALTGPGLRLHFWKAVLSAKLLKDVALSSGGSIIFPAQKRTRCHNGDTIERAGGQTIVV